MTTPPTQPDTTMTAIEVQADASELSSTCPAIVLLTHAPLGTAYLEVARHVWCCRHERLAAFDMPGDMPNGDAEAAVHAVISRLGRAQVLLLVDVEGASPHRVAQLVCSALGRDARIVTGLNPPMLLSTLPREDVDVRGLAALAAHRARRGVQIMPRGCE